MGSIVEPLIKSVPPLGGELRPGMSRLVAVYDGKGSQVLYPADHQDIAIFNQPGNTQNLAVIDVPETAIQQDPEGRMKFIGGKIQLTPIGEYPFQATWVADEAR